MDLISPYVRRAGTALKRALLTPSKVQRRAYLIIASPRSASNFTLRVLTQGSGLPGVLLKTENGFGHFSVDLGKVPFHQDFLWYQHLFPTERNKLIVTNISKAAPVLVWRDAFDWTVSMAEWFVQNGRCPWGVGTDRAMIVAKETPVPFAAAAQYVIDFELPLYLRFLAGWQDFSLRTSEILFVDFTKITQQTESVMEELKQLRWPLTCQKKPMCGRNVNYSVGQIGRGRSMLEESQIEQIARLVERTGMSWVIEH